MKDLVSIVVPVYNGEQFLRENVECILHQTYRNLEVIYVCDGCTDKTVDILQEYSMFDARMKIYDGQEKRGAAVSRNIGKKMATGDWIIFLDSDDLFEINMIEKMVCQAIKERADMCCCFWEEFDEMPKKNVYIPNTDIKLYCETYPVINTIKEKKYILQLVTHAPWTKLIHKTIYKKKSVLFQDLPNSNDIYFSFASAIEAVKIVYVDEILVHYRNSNGRNVLSEGRKKIRSYIWEAFDQVFQYIDQKDDNRELKKSFYNRVCNSILRLKGSVLYEKLYKNLRDIYFIRWEMYSDIKNELSYFNQEIYSKLCIGDLSMDKNSFVMQAKKHFIQHMAKKGNCSIWGCGYWGSKLLEKMDIAANGICHLFDSDPNKWGTDIAGKTVENFEEEWVEHIIVTSTKYYEEIKKQIGSRAGHVYDLENEIFKY